MKHIITSSILASLAISGAAIADDKAEAPAENKVAPEEMPKIEELKMAYLGVSSRAINPTTKAQLGIENGLSVESIGKGTPADKAGLKQFDILTTLGDVKLERNGDLRKAIAGHKPNDEVEVTILRKGKEEKLMVTLGERPAVVGRPRGFGALADIPEAELERLKEMFGGELPEGFGKPMILPLGPNGKQLNEEDLENLPGDVPEQLKKLLKDLPNLEGGNGFKMMGGMQMRLRDNQGRISLKDGPDGREVEVTDNEGNVQYAGPYNDEADKAGIPKDILERIEAAVGNFGGGLKRGKNGVMKLNLDLGALGGAVPQGQKLEFKFDGGGQPKLEKKAEDPPAKPQ